jgi:hypothetical protein
MFIEKMLQPSEIWGFHGSNYEEHCLLGCDAVQSSRSLPYLGSSACCLILAHIPEDSTLHGHTKI